MAGGPAQAGDEPIAPRLSFAFSQYLAAKAALSRTAVMDRSLGAMESHSCPGETVAATALSDSPATSLEACCLISLGYVGSHASLRVWEEVTSFQGANHI